MSEFSEYYERQIDWSKRTFGPGPRTLGIVEHIKKELIEVAAAPSDLSEWIDLTILAMDGYWRHGGTPATLMADLESKQQKNFARTWPTPTSEDRAVEHDRSRDALLILPDADEPLAILSARMIGHAWSPEAHEHLIAVLRKIDATATECVRRAGGEA